MWKINKKWEIWWKKDEILNKLANYYEGSFHSKTISG